MRYCLLILMVFLSCKKQVQEVTKNNDENSVLSVVKKHHDFTMVIPSFKKEVEDWTTLQNTEDFLERFKKGSANEILSNALEFKTISKALKDSIKPTLFSLPSVEARINILYNESLRLADMTYIPAITAGEVHEQTNKIMDAFSSINSKINTVLRKKQFEDAIDIDVSFIGLDTTKIDSVSKNAILEKQKDKKDLQPIQEQLKKQK